MQRQLSTNTHQVKDFVLNCIHLTDYFSAQCMFAQTEYLLYAAMTLLPVDVMKRKKLRATLQIAIGHYYLEFLTYCSKDETAIDVVKINQKTAVFKEIALEWPKKVPVETLEQAI
jgi:hypothetical protein